MWFFRSPSSETNKRSRSSVNEESEVEPPRKRSKIDDFKDAFKKRLWFLSLGNDHTSTQPVSITEPAVSNENYPLNEGLSNGFVSFNGVGPLSADVHVNGVAESPVREAERPVLSPVAFEFKRPSTINFKPKVDTAASTIVSPRRVGLAAVKLEEDRIRDGKSRAVQTYHSMSHKPQDAVRDPTRRLSAGSQRKPLDMSELDGPLYNGSEDEDGVQLVDTLISTPLKPVVMGASRVEPVIGMQRPQSRVLIPRPVPRVAEPPALRPEQQAVIQRELDGYSKLTEGFNRLRLDIQSLTARQPGETWRDLQIEEIEREAAEQKKLRELRERKVEPVMPELTEEQRAKVQSVFFDGNADDVVVKIENANITKHDLRTLRGNTWLNDEVINAYMFLLVERAKQAERKVHCFKTHFYSTLRDNGYDKVRRWTKKTDIFSYDYVIVPIHMGSHWTLVRINFVEQRFEYYDSYFDRNVKCLQILRNYIQRESLDKKKVEYDLTGWTDHYPGEDELPRQHNTSDCGVFACQFAECVACDRKIRFTEDNMQDFRSLMAYEIMTAKLLR
eukprot:Colp12_sorted_trinity150504_noHs@5904